MLARRSIRGTLFLAYSFLITFTAAVLVVYFALWGTMRLREDAQARLGALVESLSMNVDGELRKLDDVSLAVLYSNLVKERFLRYIEDGEGRRVGRPVTAFGANEKELVDILLAIIGPAMNARQINIYDFHGIGFGTGMDNRPRTIDPATPWFAAALKAGGSLVLGGPHDDDALQRISSLPSAERESFVSLGRLFFNRYSTPIGVVEVEESADTIFASLERLVEGSPLGERALVFDATGRLLYPRSLQDERVADAYRPAQGDGARGAPRATRNPLTGRGEIVCEKTSELSGWTVAVITDEGALLSPLSSFVRDSVFIALLILSGSLLIAFLVARRITWPIARLHGAISALDIDSLGEQPRGGLGSGLNEIESLNHAFLIMQTKLRRSIDERILAHRREMQARMLALQSQMNPHFLYNTLATISVLAEEGMSIEAVALCGNVSAMLRYISSQKSTYAAAGAEIEYTRQYLRCITARHGRKLRPVFEVDGDFAALRIPKLLIQPLVENAVKYATGKEPPWTIRVRAAVGEKGWRVTIEDDGPGFSDEALGAITAAADGAGDGEEFHGLELDGMGLANICARLRLAYGREAVFSCGNRTVGGAFV
ncbi:MAG TPA: histidine kinase, partial [Spirochaetia bacterium]